MHVTTVSARVRQAHGAGISRPSPIADHRGPRNSHRFDGLEALRLPAVAGVTLAPCGLGRAVRRVRGTYAALFSFAADAVAAVDAPTRAIEAGVRRRAGEIASG